MLKIVVSGAAGRMGRRVLACALQDTQVEVVGGVEHPAHANVGMCIGELVGGSRSGARVVGDIDEVIEAAHVLIDFSQHEAAAAILDRAAARGKSLVVGTTGFSDEERKRLAGLAGSVPVVWSSNFSAGVNLLFHLVERSADILREEWDVEIVEQHHRYKADAPSGTALRLAQIIADVQDLKLAEALRHGRSGELGPRGEREIGISAIRAGDCVGTHTVIFGGMSEQLEFTHRATNRDVFARGALRAAKFVAGCRPGLYDMRDVLGLR